MQQEASEQSDLENLDQDVVAHEVCGFVEHHGIIKDDNQQIDTQVYQQEYNQKNPCQGH
jgi:hypothetical protein